MRASSYKLGRKCGCGKQIIDRSKTGLCHPCFMRKLTSDPERGKKVSAGLKRYLSDPANKAKHNERARRGGITKSRDLEWCERAAKIMREQVQPLSQAPESLAKRDYSLTGRLSGESKLSWCPQEMRARYRKLTKGMKMKKADAMPLVLKEWADIEAARSPDMQSAVDWLRRLAPIKQLDDGRYQHGSAILTSGEVMARAKFRGWQPFNYVKQPVDNGESTLFSANSNSKNATRTNRETQEESLAA